MDQAQLHEKLTGIFRETFDTPALVIHDGMTADDVEQWDSLSHINLVLAVEKAFSIRLTTREVRGMKNVGDLIGLIRQKAA